MAVFAPKELNLESLSTWRTLSANQSHRRERLVVWLARAFHRVFYRINRNDNLELAELAEKIGLKEGREGVGFILQRAE